MKDRKGRKIISQLDMTLEQIDGKPEPRTRTLLRSMIAALDAGDDQTFFDCYELLTKIVLEMLLKPNKGASGPAPAAGAGYAGRTGSASESGGQHE